MRHCKNLNVEAQLKKNYTKTNYMIVTDTIYIFDLIVHVISQPQTPFLTSESSTSLIQLAVKIHNRRITIEWFQRARTISYCCMAHILITGFIMFVGNKL